MPISLIHCYITFTDITFHEDIPYSPSSSPLQASSSPPSSLLPSLRISTIIAPFSMLPPFIISEDYLTLLLLIMLILGFLSYVPLIDPSVLLVNAYMMFESTLTLLVPIKLNKPPPNDLYLPISLWKGAMIVPNIL